MTNTAIFIANCVVNAVLSCTAIMLNIVTILALRKPLPTLPKNFKTVLLSMSVADLGVGLLVQPLYIALQAFIEIGSNNEALLVKTYVVTMYLLCLVSFLNVTVLSADRFLVIHLHLRYNELVTHKRAVAVVISIWVSAAFISLLELWRSTTVPYIIGIILIVCSIATSLFSYKIYLVVRRHANHIQEMQVQQAAQNGAAMEDDVRQRKSAATAFYVFLFLLICYVPNICIINAYLILGPDRPIPAIITICAETLLYLNSSLNPLIYCWKIKQIRHTIKNLLRNVYSCHD